MDNKEKQKKAGNEIKIKNENDNNKINNVMYNNQNGDSNQNLNDDELFKEKSREKIILVAIIYIVLIIEILLIY